MKTWTIFPFLLATLLACDTVDEKQQIKQLEIQLIATEAQLLNVRSELAKCSTSNDSIIQLYSKQSQRDSI